MFRFSPVGRVAGEVKEGEEERCPEGEPVRRQQEGQPEREPSAVRGGGVERERRR